MSLICRPQAFKTGRTHEMNLRTKPSKRNNGIHVFRLYNEVHV